MDKIYVAPSYENFKIVGEPFKNEKGRLYVKVKGTCPRCGGSGHYSYNQMDGTRCYGCQGSGISVQTVRAYTEKEYNALQRAKTRAAEKREAAEAARIQDALDHADEYKHEVALKRGFGENEKIYLVYGDDTYAIKDELKKLGGKFDPTFKWFFSKEVELPEGYNLCELAFDEVYDYNPESKWASFKEDAKNIVARKIAKLKGPSTSEFYPGVEKERLRNITAKVASIRGFEGIYGYTHVYTFTSGNYVFVWMTSKTLTVAVGETVDLTGTIKKFDEYMGIKNTYLTRCSIKPIK